MGDHKGGARGVLRQVVTGQRSAEDAIREINPDFVEFINDDKPFVYGALRYLNSGGPSNGYQMFHFLTEVLPPVRLFIERTLSPRAKAKQDAQLNRRLEAVDDDLNKFGVVDVYSGEMTEGRVPATADVRDIGENPTFVNMTPNLGQIIRGAIRDKLISPKAANRLLGSVESALKTLDNNPAYRNLPEAQAAAIRQLVSHMAGLTAIRTQMYDIQAMYSTGNTAVELGNGIPRIINRQQQDAIRMANAINRAIGDNTPTLASEDNLPARGTLGRQIYQQIIAANGAIAYNSALKMRRNNKTKLNLLSRAIQERI